MILRGEKTWEMRSQPCRHRGPIALIEKGTGKVVGTAKIVDDLAPLSEAVMRANVAKHGIPNNEIGSAVRAGWVRPWVLSDVVRLASPVPYEHTSGGSWVNLSKAEEDAIARAAHGAMLIGKSAPAPEPISPGSSALAMGAGPISSNDARVSVRQVGNKVSIDVTWDDTAGQSGLHSPSGLLLIFQTCLFTVLAISAIGFVFHFVIGVFSSSLSAISAFKWLIPLFISSALIGIFGPKEFFDKM